jgi:DNA-binding NarL/FixJ family response regulator
VYVFFNWISVPWDDGERFMKVLIVDEHALIREALYAVLRQLKREAVIFEASSSRQAVDIVEEHPDISLILLDINLPDRDGFSVLRDLRDSYPTIAIIILSSSNDQDTVKRAFKLGALGFIPKTTERDVMLNAIELVFSGGIYIPSEILEETPSPRLTNKPTTPDFLKGLGLTDRQIEVLALLMKGKQQDHCQDPQHGSADSEKSHHGRSQGAQRNEPHRGSHKSRKNGLGIVLEIRVMKPLGYPSHRHDPSRVRA